MANMKISDIIAEARGVFGVLREHGYDVVSVDRMESIIDRIEKAHKREMDELVDASVHTNELLTKQIEAKDEELLNIRKSLARVMEVTGDCRKCEECGDETCPWFGEPDGCNNREGRALFLAGKLVDPLKMKDAKNEKLRALVKELADELEAIKAGTEFDPYIGGKWIIEEEAFDPVHAGSLVDKAREVVKDA